jgi:hypothetical protein
VGKRARNIVLPPGAPAISALSQFPLLDYHLEMIKWHNHDTAAGARHLALVTRGRLWAGGKLDKQGAIAPGGERGK